MKANHLISYNEAFGSPISTFPSLQGEHNLVVRISLSPSPLSQNLTNERMRYLLSNASILKPLSSIPQLSWIFFFSRFCSNYALAFFFKCQDISINFFKSIVYSLSNTKTMVSLYNSLQVIKGKLNIKFCKL